MVHQRIENIDDRDAPAAFGVYGRVTGDRPRIEALVAGECVQKYAHFDGAGPAFAGPVDVAVDASPERTRLLIVHRATANVARLDCRTGLVEALPVGAGARGVIVDGTTGDAFVDNAFDHSISRLRAVDGEGEAVVTVRRTPGPSHLAPRAEVGRRLFHGATRSALTPAGVLSCGTCHPDGGEDGLVWFVHLPDAPQKLRRTPPAWGGRPALSPFRADGAFADAAELTHATVVGLMGGTGLAIDLAPVAAYLAELPLPSPAATDDASGSVLERGARVFDSAGCAECHPAPLYTDGRAHAVALATDPDGLRGEIQTRSLLGLRSRGPYLNDGSAPTLVGVLERDTQDLHGQTSVLAPAEREALLAFLRHL